jgi:hypothetical protein
MRSRLAPVISSLLKESYTRAYHSMVTAQQLAELEEVIQVGPALSQLLVLATESHLVWRA